MKVGLARLLFGLNKADQEPPKLIAGMLWFTHPRWLDRAGGHDVVGRRRTQLHTSQP